MSDYLTTLARRALSPPRSIWPRPAARFETPTRVDRPLREQSRAPAPSRVVPESPERSVAGPTRIAEAEATRGADGSIAGTPSQRGVASRRGPQLEEPDTVRATHVDDAHGRAPRSGHAVDAGPPSGAVGPPPERVDHRPVTTPPTEAEPQLAIERTVPSAQNSDDHEAAANEVDKPVVDGNLDPVREMATTASAPTRRWPSRSRPRRARAERDVEPHITVTIGRVEVTSPDRQAPPTDVEIQQPAVGLDDYLKDRRRS